MKYGTRPHRGGLLESIKLKKYISKHDFYGLLYSDETYEFYAFDMRCKQLLFLNKDFIWLFIEFTDKELYRVGDLLVRSHFVTED